MEERKKERKKERWRKRNKERKMGEKRERKKIFYAFSYVETFKSGVILKQKADYSQE